MTSWYEQNWSGACSNWHAPSLERCVHVTEFENRKYSCNEESGSLGERKRGVEGSIRQKGGWWGSEEKKSAKNLRIWSQNVQALGGVRCGGER